MFTGLAIQVLGSLRGGAFSPCPLQPCFHFQGERVAVGSKAWGSPALVLDDSTVSPRHALIVHEGQGWIVEDLDSDNGIRSLPSLPTPEMRLEGARQASRVEFAEEFCCCIGAVVLRLRPVVEQVPAC